MWYFLSHQYIKWPRKNPDRMLYQNGRQVNKKEFNQKYDAWLEGRSYQKTHDTDWTIDWRHSNRFRIHLSLSNEEISGILRKEYQTLIRILSIETDLDTFNKWFLRNWNRIYTLNMGNVLCGCHAGPSSPKYSYGKSNYYCICELISFSV